MIWVYILLFLIALMLIFFWSNIHIKIKYEDKLYIYLRLWFFSIDLLSISNKKTKRPKKEKKKAVKAEKKDTKKQHGKKTLIDKLKDRGLSNNIELLKNLLSVAVKSLKRILRNTVIEYIDLNYIIVGEDAAATAIKYGNVYAFVYPVLSMMKNSSVCKKQNVNIIAGFQEKEETIKMAADFHIRISVLVSTMLFLLFNCIKYLRDINNK